MASNGDSRGGLLTAGGVLSIIAGAFEVIGGGIILALASLGIPLRLWLLQHIPQFWEGCAVAVIPIVLIIVGGLILALGIVAIAGGASALRRKSFGLSLAGAICALPSIILGILAVIFVSLARREFRARIRRRSGGMADALRSGRSVLKDVRVQIPPSAPCGWGPRLNGGEYTPVAQLDRAQPCGGWGRGFKSRQACHGRLAQW